MIYLNENRAAMQKMQVCRRVIKAKKHANA